MVLSNLLFNSIASKLKLKTSLLKKEQVYTENLLNKVIFLAKLNESNFKNFSLSNFTKNKKPRDDVQDFMVMYIVSIYYLKANTMIHVSDVKGNIKLFYSAGSVGLKGKQKKKRIIAVFKLISLLLKKTKFLSKKPVALHLNNVESNKDLIINKMQEHFFIKIIRSFNKSPYNGCRKKKIRRKKRTQKFK